MVEDDNPATPLRTQVIVNPETVKSTPGTGDKLLTTSIILGLVLLLYLSIYGRIFQPLLEAASANRLTSAIVRPSAIWVVMGSLLLAFRTVLLFRYKPFPAAALDDAPSLTVIIPAYSEGAMAGKTIDSFAQASYPHERLEIFVVDDGSRDDTWEHIVKA